jgi:hypothetical protein
MFHQTRRIVPTIAFAAIVFAASATGVFASVAPNASGSSQVVTSSVKHFANCAALNKVYHHGVGRKGAKDHVTARTKRVTNFKVSNALYAANKGRDRDKDGIACEKH